MWQDLAQIVLKANQFSRESIKNGVEANEIDLAAREYISTCGYGEFFTHRTGHGIGLKEHEAPYISHSERTKIREGMVFTIEPGIYFSGQGGIRIEDDVVATEKGSRTLTTLPREIVQI
jgi:Xaa-Pro dipeptidase